MENGHNPGQPDEPKPDKATRSRRRRNVVGTSAHRDDYVRLMQAGWTSLALERYAAYRYGEDIPARTFRDYKKAKHIETESTPLQGWSAVEALDVVNERSTLIRMQQARLRVDVGLEIGDGSESRGGMNKLLSTTRHEIELLSKLLDAHKADLQDLGLMPRAGDEVRITHVGGLGEADAAGRVPKSQSLGELLGWQEEDPAAAAELAKVLHLSMKSKGQEAG